MDTEKAPSDLPAASHDAPATAPAPSAASFAAVEAALEAVKEQAAAPAEAAQAEAAPASPAAAEPAITVAPNPAPSGAPEISVTGERPAEPARAAPRPAARLLPPRPAKAAPRLQRGRLALLAASIALAAGLGAAAGAAAFAGFAKPNASRIAAAPAKPAATSDEIKGVRESLAQLRAQNKALGESIATLRSHMEASGRGTQGQLARLNESVERLERAQAEPQARIAKLSEAVDRLEKRGTVAAPAPAETTASVKPPAPPPAKEARVQNETPVIDGWQLRRVYDGVALIQGRYGAMEVEVGDEIRGAGRVQDIKRQDGRWVVVTNRGLILQR